MNTELVKHGENVIDYATVKAVLNAPNAPDEVIDMASSYCAAAGLDIMRKPVAIISYGKKHEVVFTIQAITTIASRAGWAGSDAIVFSDQTVTVGGKKYPAYGYQVVYKMIQGQRCAFTGPKVYLAERHKNSWGNAGVMAMYQKCVTAAALRLAFPEQLAHAYVEDEMHYDAKTNVNNDGIETLRQAAKQVDSIEAKVVQSVDDELSSLRECKTVSELDEVAKTIREHVELSADAEDQIRQEYKRLREELCSGEED